MSPDCPEPLKLSPGQEPTYMLGAKILARLTYPSAEDQARRGELQDALCAIALHMNANLDPKDRTVLTVPANIFRFTDRQLEIRQKFTAKKLQERLIAGRMAVTFLKVFEEGEIPVALKGVKRLSLNQIAEFVTATEGYKESGNLEQRFWRPSRPVIHIAAALAVVGQEWERRGEKLSFYHLLLHLDLIVQIVERAVVFVQVIGRYPRFPMAAGALVQIQVAE